MPDRTPEAVIVLDDDRIGLRGFIALHSTAAGPGFGGIRRMAYASADHARADALRLAEAMTTKCALAELPAGGAKTTLMIPERTDVSWPAVYRAVGDAVDALGGRYVCGPDVGTSSEALGWVRERTPHVNPEGNDAGASTAAGVLSGLTALWRVLGIDDPASATVAVQGLGAVGNAVAQQLCHQGTRVIGADPDASARARAERLGVVVVPCESIVAAPCDVLMPCAMGQGLSEASVATLSCRAVCGSANNQLVDDAAAWALLRRGIVHAPDEIVSAGAVIEGVWTVSGRGQPDVASRVTASRVTASIAGIADVLAATLQTATLQQTPPALVARRRAQAQVLGSPG